MAGGDCRRAQAHINEVLRDGVLTRGHANWMFGQNLTDPSKAYFEDGGVQYHAVALMVVKVTQTARLGMQDRVLGAAVARDARVRAQGAAARLRGHAPAVRGARQAAVPFRRESVAGGGARFQQRLIDKSMLRAFMPFIEQQWRVSDAATPTSGAQAEWFSLRPDVHERTVIDCIENALHRPPRRILAGWRHEDARFPPNTRVGAFTEQAYATDRNAALRDRRTRGEAAGGVGVRVLRWWGYGVGLWYGTVVRNTAAGGASVRFDDYAPTGGGGVPNTAQDELVAVDAAEFDVLRLAAQEAVAAVARAARRERAARRGAPAAGGTALDALFAWRAGGLLRTNISATYMCLHARPR